MNNRSIVVWRKKPVTTAVHECVDQPNPLKVLFSVVRVLATTSRPEPRGNGTVNHDRFAPVLKALEHGGLPAAADWEDELSLYLAELEGVRPRSLTHDESLAFWLNLYNAGAVQLAIEAFRRNETSVLRIPGGFSRPLAKVESESLSLDAIEHGKLRRLRDPRIHGALVCGSLSCPTLRAEPYRGDGLDFQLDDQMRAFLRGGGAIPGTGTVMLSRVFLWFGADFVRPHRMPTFLPASKSKILSALRPWLPDTVADAEAVEFQSYDWGLSCTVG